MEVAFQPAGYEDALAFLLGRIDYERVPPEGYRSREYKLDRMRDLLSRLEDPQRQLKVVHIAGTKGKGSTAAMLASIAAAAGLRVGAFTSPHLDRVEERIAVNGQPCLPTQLVQLVEGIRPVVEAMDQEAGRSTAASSPARGPTYFELTTALALQHFAQQQVDLAILEVGLGGRLDSTNVCQPLCTAITSISYDHTRQLGNTLAKIAAEKAGIIKAGVPVVSGVTSSAARAVIAAQATVRGAPLLQWDEDFAFTYHPPGGPVGYEPHPRSAPGGGDDHQSVSNHFDYVQRSGPAERSLLGVPLSLLGRHQAANAAVAVTIAGILERQGLPLNESAIRQGLATTRCPARVELVRLRPAILVDAAHNVASIEALGEVLDECFPAGPRWLIFASTVGKDIPGMLARLVTQFDRIFVTRYANNPRGVAVEELAVLAESAALATGARTQEVTVCADPASTWQAVQGTV
ncbi:MAG: bifunctional folylpolyglutamate synthase/dihydrofolate synthase, partial [Planctomycetales bacterium]|nr:bifunctional folylpolyglutamate synthase/dihydrofolate synthase [Planctomycetales bacterium]